ncbi:MAG: hypothetical protein IPM74_07655 [Crocinitomicaceae bacterium]|nr:hypothetical protein [Crocinitomicaceae bacterium]MBK8925775.1 hypothetical protein [Crocinitomicaceae bacterium]
MAHQQTTRDINLTGFKPIDKLFYDYELNRFGIISMLILVFGTLGGVAVGVGALDSIMQLILVVLPTMCALAMILAVSPMRAIVYSSFAAILVDIFVIAYNLIIL